MVDLFFSGDFGYGNISDFTEELLSAISDNNEVRIVISSDGGDVYRCLDLCDLLIHLRFEKEIAIDTYALGSCVSAGILLFLCGKTRSCCPTTTFFWHRPIIEGLVEAPPEVIKNYLDRNEKVYDGMIDKIIAVSGVNKDFIKGQDRYGKWLDIEEAKGVGLLNSGPEYLK